jgi:hypothetical protein
VKSFVAALAVVIASTTARADPAPKPIRDIVITSPGTRAKSNIAIIAGLAGGAVVFGGIGLYFHLDSQNNANAVNAATFTGRNWSTALQQKYDRSERSATTAAVFYGLGTACLLGSIVYAVITEPKEERTVIHPHTAGFRQPTLRSTRGGAVLGGEWSF